MKFFRVLMVLFIAVAVIGSCKKEHKEITPELFLEMETKILHTDLSPDAKEDIVEEYGVSLKQYNDYEEMVENDNKLKEKIGEIRLNQQKK